MDANGESMDRRWPRGIHVLEHTTGAPWLPVAQLENKYVVDYICSANDFIMEIDLVTGSYGSP